MVAVSLAMVAAAGAHLRGSPATSRPASFRAVAPVVAAAALTPAGAATLQLAQAAPPAASPAPKPLPKPASTNPPPVRTPPWWSGVCDVNDHPGSFPLSTWDGLTACAPGPNRGGYDQTVLFFPRAWGEYEWECVELVMRWMYLEYGVHPYPANGGSVVANYSPSDGGGLRRVANDGKSLPRPGDVLSMGTPWEEGHTAVVTGVHVAHGDGWLSDIEENMDGGNGLDTISVVNGVVQPEWGFPVLGWLAVPAPATTSAAAAPTLASWGGGPAGVLDPGVAALAAGGVSHLAAVRWAAAHPPAQPAGAWPPASLLDILLAREGLFQQLVGPQRGS